MSHTALVGSDVGDSVAFCGETFGALIQHTEVWSTTGLAYGLHVHYKIRKRDMSFCRCSGTGPCLTTSSKPHCLPLRDVYCTTGKHLMIPPSDCLNFQILVRLGDSEYVLLKLLCIYYM
jgi:hypothetical protein